MAVLAVVLTVPVAWAQESNSEAQASPGAMQTLDALLTEALENNPELHQSTPQESIAQIIARKGNCWENAAEAVILHWIENLSILVV